mmetsp:Transcript_28486/g.42255  ORF Transcript_28486/g.42255 Transcript_28486/m.42255 type:complete len:302 (+) Transcript_28486:286-1191(+)
MNEEASFDSSLLTSSMLSKNKEKVSLRTFGDEDEDTTVATTVNTNEDEEFIAEEEQLRRTHIRDEAQQLRRVAIIGLLYLQVALFGLVFLVDDDQVWIWFLFQIFMILWACSTCYRQNPEETTNCIKGIGFMVCSIVVVVLALLPWILFLNYATFFPFEDWWKVVLVSNAQSILVWLGYFYFNKHCDETLISSDNLLAFGWKWALLYIFYNFLRFINAGFTFFTVFNVLIESPAFGYITLWKILLALFLSLLYYTASELASIIPVAGVLLLFEGRCCRNGDTADNEAASQQTNGIAMVEIV